MTYIEIVSLNNKAREVLESFVIDVLKCKDRKQRALWKVSGKSFQIVKQEPFTIRDHYHNIIGNNPAFMSEQLRLLVDALGEKGLVKGLDYSVVVLDE